jgi:C-terminal peptidase prc
VPRQIWAFPQSWAVTVIMLASTGSTCPSAAQTPPVTPSAPAKPAAQSPATAAAVEQLFTVLDRVVSSYVRPAIYGRLAAAALNGAIRKSGGTIDAATANAIKTIAAADANREAARATLTGALTGWNARAINPANRLTATQLVLAVLAELGPVNEYLPDGNPPLPPTMGGIGLELTRRNGALVVVSAMKDRPAESGGVRADDEVLIISVRTADDTAWQDYPVKSLDLEKVVALLRGPAGSQMRLTLRRLDKPKALSVQLTREVIAPDPVGHSMIGKDYGYIRIRQFGSTTAARMPEAVAAVRASAGDQFAGLVLDLRGNRGGLVDQAIAVADQFLDRGRITRLEGRNLLDNRTLDATPGDIANGRPIVVLVNGATAAGAELLALALQKNGRARVVGERTAGSASVTTVYEAGPPALIRIQTGHWLDPSDVTWESKGITPDVLTSAEDRAGSPDGELQRAIAVLRGGR